MKDVLMIETIARVCHEANRVFCEQIGDHSQHVWEISPDWQKDSARNGVKAHLNSDLTPEQSHESWMNQKVAEGWKFGPTKDAILKTHPCVMPYNQLPIQQRAKDYLFRNIVHAFKQVVNDEKE